MTKESLRRQIRDRLKALAPGERDALSLRIRGAINAHEAFQGAATVAVFDPLPSEPDIAPLAGKAGIGRTVAYPRCQGSDLAFYAVETEDQLLPSPLGRFREPDPAACRPVPVGELDLILVPGLAFAPDGGVRLGRGGGFYDRLLADPQRRAAAIGVAFSFQLRADLPAEPHDQPVDVVLTENSIS